MNLKDVSTDRCRRTFASYCTFPFNSLDFAIVLWFLIGRAMGSRAALGLANEIGKSDTPCCVKGVVCLSYPLYADDEKEKLNDEPLKAMSLPGLFVNTVGDKASDKEKLEEILGKNSAVQINWVEAADSFHKANGRKESDVFDEVNDIVISWCKEQMKGAKEDEEKENGAKTEPESKDRKRKSQGEASTDDKKKYKEN